ncbi:Xylulose kinase [Olea europaea subsp. europaea]|uniref:Xylulose kinase n=1 Tax=Olea europaea subsp. europaea TaxID=158383 RepID=A0A8S0RYR0_OLEEU|nr:Xylulose kinase [Olea europaea subsp. europaea]
MEDCSLPKDAYFLGFDSSTQSLKATVLDSNLNIVAAEIVNFDSELSHYKTKDGVYRDPLVNGRIVSPTIMWVEALDLVLQRLQKSNLDFGKIAAVSGSGQQHGSVYWKNGSSKILSSFDPKKLLIDQLRDAFSIKESPIWMDSSATEQCKAIEKAVGGALKLSELTGSRAYERFTGPQIRRISETQPEVYQNTERISLATAPGLEEKLGKLAPAHAVAGLIAPYFVERYDFNKNCLIVQWSGNNPNSVTGLTLNSPGDLAISLGHVFPNPVDPKSYMVMLCYKNGSLAREDIRNQCADKSREVFNKFLQQTRPLNGGKLGFYYKDHEILPPLPVGFHRYVLKNFNGESLDGGSECEVQDFDPPSEVRALVEGQLLSMRAHAERFGMPSPPKRIIATGGASANNYILSSIASIFGCNVYTVQRPDSASMGAALRAAHSLLCNKKGNFVPISSMYVDNLEKTSLNCKLAATAGDQNGCEIEIGVAKVHKQMDK